MKKLVIILIVVAIIALFPLRFSIKDGGSVYYAPITGIYGVTVYDGMLSYTNERLKGIEIYIFGKTVYSNTYIEVE